MLRHHPLLSVVVYDSDITARYSDTYRRYCEGRALGDGTALRLARFFDTSPEFWMNLQAMHDLTKARN